VIKTCGNFQGKLLQPNAGRSTTECLISGLVHKLVKSHQPLSVESAKSSRTEAKAASEFPVAPWTAGYG